MKRIGLFIVAVAFTTSLAAQEVSAVENVDVEDVAVETVEVQATVTDEQIMEALTKDEGLHTATLGHLQEHPDTSEAVAALDAEYEGSQQDIINSVLRNPQLSSVALDYVKSNPELLSKVASLVSM